MFTSRLQFFIFIFYFIQVSIRKKRGDIFIFGLQEEIEVTFLYLVYKRRQRSFSKYQKKIIVIFIVFNIFYTNSHKQKIKQKESDGFLGLKLAQPTFMGLIFSLMSKNRQKRVFQKSLSKLQVQLALPFHFLFKF